MRFSKAIVEFERGLVILIDNIIKEDRYFLEAVAYIFRGDTQYVLAVRDKQKKELLGELDECL